MENNFVHTDKLKFQVFEEKMVTCNQITIKGGHSNNKANDEGNINIEQTQTVSNKFINGPR
jgi:hypothetical protein